MEARANVPITGADVEVVAKARRRTFTAEYERWVLKEADGGATAGAVGALLQLERLYSSYGSLGLCPAYVRSHEEL